MIVGLTTRSWTKTKTQKRSLEVVARLKETLGKGPCPKCGKVSMVPDAKGFCYYCLECGWAESQDAYLRGLAGYPVEYVD